MKITKKETHYEAVIQRADGVWDCFDIIISFNGKIKIETKSQASRTIDEQIEALQSLIIAIKDIHTI